MIAPVRPRRRARRVVFLQWAAPLFFIEMVALVLVINFGAPEFHIAAAILLVVLSAWNLLFALSSIWSDLVRLHRRRARAREAAALAARASRQITPRDVRTWMDINAPVRDMSDPWAGVRSRDD
ncbi:MAG: hypothetical protein KGL39_26510 [Patescibacteria group bacterium]|nr:hypothetical protein [Patescibacteria group bacterium]